MSVEYIDSILRRALDGDISVRLDEHEVGPEAAGLAHTMNRVLEKLADAKELEILKKRADNFLGHNPQAIAVLSGDKRRLAINSEYQKVWHGSHDELMNKKLYDFDISLTGGDDFYASFQTKRQAVSDFEVSWPDGSKSYLRLFQVPILDDNGDIDVNYYIYQDFTPEKALAAYIQTEMDRVASNLVRLSEGDLGFDTEVRVAGRYTGEAREAFLGIAGGFMKVQKAFSETITDIEALEAEIRAGHVSSRADAGRHAGEFATVLESMNSALDAFTAPMQETMRLANEYAGGNFTARTDESLEYAGDFLALRDSLDNIGISVSELVGQAKKTISNVGVGTSEASKGSDEVAKASEQVAMTSQKCADLSKDLLIEIEDISNQITDLSSSNEEVASTAQGILKNAQNVADMGDDALKLGEDANSRMASVESITNQSMQEIGGLRDQMGEINKIVRMITDIANQINLLALNAAIEAAHAGEHGRGFAVVAGEVKELAGEARTATEQIETVIVGVQNGTEKTAEAIGSANTEVNSGVESVNATIEALNRMVKGAGSVTEDIGEIASAINDQAMITGNVVRAADKGTDLTKETLTEVEELAALAEEASASIEEIGNAIHEVDQMADQVQTDMNRFRV